MGCNITAGYKVPCKDFVGGIKNIWFGALDDFETGVTEASGVVTVLPTATIYQFDLKRGTGSYTETPQPSVENNTVFWEQVTVLLASVLVKTRGTATDRLNFEALQRGRWVVFVRDENDNIFMTGRFTGAELTAGTNGTGTALGDANGYNLTFTAQERYQAPILSDYTTEPFDNFVPITVVKGT